MAELLTSPDPVAARPTGRTDPSGATHPAEPAPTADVPGARAGVQVMALTLWGVVGTLLGYGVLQTAVKASALFG